MSSGNSVCYFKNGSNKCVSSGSGKSNSEGGSRHRKNGEVVKCSEGSIDSFLFRTDVLAIQHWMVACISEEPALFSMCTGRRAVKIIIQEVPSELNLFWILARELIRESHNHLEVKS